MAITGQAAQLIVEKALADPDFMTRLVADPRGAGQEAGIELSDGDAEALGALQGKSEEGMVEALRARVSHSGLSRGLPRR